MSLGKLRMSRFVPVKMNQHKKSSSESSALPVKWMTRPYKPSRAAYPAWVIRNRMTSADLQAIGIRGDSSMDGVELVLMALGNTDRTRKTGLEKAMIIEEVSVIAALAQRAHDTHIDHTLKIQALSNGRQPGGDLLNR